MKTYRDGVLVTDIAFTNSVAAAAGTLYLGSRSGISMFYNGLIDDVRIYNRALSAAEIQAIYNATK